jgi:hypothetical protein
MEVDADDSFLESLALDNMHIGEHMPEDAGWSGASVAAVLSEVLAGPISFYHWLERQQREGPFFSSVWLADYITQAAGLGLVHAFAAEDGGEYLVILETGTVLDLPEWLHNLGAWFRADRPALLGALATQITAPGDSVPTRRK